MDYTSSIDSALAPPNKPPSRPIRILHIVGGMELAGVETTLMHMLRLLDRDRFEMDFLVHTDEKCAYDDEIRALGSKLISCPKVRQPWAYAADFKQILQEYGPYDVVHSHIHHFGGFVLRLADEAGVPVRVAHSRINSSPADVEAKFLRRMYVSLMERWTMRHANFGLASSRQAAECLFGAGWEDNPTWNTILLPARDLSSFHQEVDVAEVRRELNIPADAWVIGNVARLEEQKNHTFLLDVMAEVVKQDDKACLLLIGQGSLRSRMAEKAARLGIKERVILAGTRSDIPRVMLGAMDIFVFPSLYEGLGSVGFEAQAAGLPCIFADTIPDELDVVDALVKRLSLSLPAVAWATEIIAHRHGNSDISQAEALQLIEASQFNIATSLRRLEEIYQNQCGRTV